MLLCRKPQEFLADGQSGTDVASDDWSTAHGRRDLLQSEPAGINWKASTIAEEAMPKARARKAALKEILAEQKRKLWQELRADVFGKLGDDYHKEFDQAMDSGDLSVMDLLESVDAELVNMRQEQFRKLEAAERKLDAGTYGICENCGKEIGEERLSAVPFAVCCVRCEEKLEGTRGRSRRTTL
jgi:DnaK suppressor protein